VEAAKSVCEVTKDQKRKERDTWWWSEDVQRAVKNKKESLENWQKMLHDTSLKAAYKKACKNRVWSLKQSRKPQSIYI